MIPLPGGTPATSRRILSTGAPELRRPRAVGGTALLFVLLLTSGAVRAQSPAIEITGLDPEAESNVRATLSLAREPCDTESWRIDRAFERVDGQVRRALRSLGYYAPEVTTVERLAGDDCFGARIAIEPGARVKVREVDIRVTGAGSDSREIAAAVAAFPLVAGEPLRHARYDNGKSAILSAARRRGYFDARFELSQLRVDPTAGHADVVLTLTTGMRYRFGEIRIQPGELDAAEISRRIAIAEGDYYDADLISDSYRQLVDSGYFETVEIRPLPDETAWGKTPVSIGYTLRKRYLFSFGVGAATDTGPRISARFENRLLTGSGHRFSAGGKLAAKDTDVTARYTIPSGMLGIGQLEFYAGYRLEDLDDYESRSSKIGASITRERFGDWNETVRLELIDEETTSEDLVIDATMLVPGIGWYRSRADDPLRPTHGTRFSLELRGGIDQVGSAADFAQATAGAKWIFSPLPGTRVLSRLDLGSTWSDTFDSLPASFRYATGGDVSVRGYRYKAIGPETESGRVIGGRYLAVGSLEVEFEVKDDFGVAAFVDHGAAFDHLDEGLKTGVGIGARWYSPVGPVRVDLAHPLDDDYGEFRLHLTMGLAL